MTPKVVVMDKEKSSSKNKKGGKGDAAAKRSSRRIWGEARKEIIPLSVGAIALVASSSVNQGTYYIALHCILALCYLNGSKKNKSINPLS